MTKIAIVHYSLYGHVATMSEAVKKGVEAGGATCDIYQVPETLPEEVLAKMHAPPKGDYPIITADKLTEYDGIIFGISGRYGMISAQLKVRSYVRANHCLFGILGRSTDLNLVSDSTLFSRSN
jgi:NAD(P)H dehydrogenase (quinone)